MLIGKWMNQNGSTLEISDATERRISGQFLSAKGRATTNEIYTVEGCVNDDLVTFVVDFRNDDRNLHSIANFTGRLVERDRIHTIWILARQYSDLESKTPTETWNTFLTNTDEFRRVG